MCFAANKIPLSASGGLSGIVELALIRDEIIEFGTVHIRINGNNRSKVRFDCGGFIDMIVDADIIFDVNEFVPENPITGEQIPNKSIEVNFVTTLQSWSDLMVEVSLPPFQLKSLKGIGFEVNRAIFDFSDLSNPAGLIFPEDYPGLIEFAGHPQLWQGFFMHEATLRLPPELNNGQRIQIKASGLILDHSGVSGTFSAEDLLPIDKGKLGGWAFSIDRAAIGFLSNSLIKGELNGKINLPIMKEGHSLAYSAMVDYKGDFLFSASFPEAFDVPMFKAQMSIDPSSSLSIQNINDRLAVTAILNGTINIRAPLGDAADDTTGYDKNKKGLSFSGLRFEQMVVSTSSHGFKPGIWSVSEIGFKGGGLNGFSISLSDIGVRESADGSVGLGFTGKVNFSGEKYCASASITLWSEKQNHNDNYRYAFRRTEIHELFMKVDDEAISIEGYFAVFKKDPKYGDGFAAKVRAKFLIIGLSATAMFGEVNDFKYFYIDALADLSNLPVTMGAVAFYGFGGGAYSHMRQILPSGNPLAATQNASEARSIINYEPDKSTLFGFKATVILGTAGNPAAFNARVTFEMNFNSNGGVKNVMFYGAGYFMTPLDVLNDNQTGPVYGTAFIGYDVDNRTFHSNLKVYVNIAGGLIRGINPGNLAGEAVIHVDPHDWYIHIGRPAARVGLEISIFGISIVNGSYFMMGTRIDEMPPPPDKVLAILGTKVARRPGGDLSLKGFCFGSSFAISTGEKQFLIFFASFDMGLGFDVILADRSGYVCSYNGEEPGINGWYAEGQVYAYVEGDIGINIKIFSKRIKTSILNIGAATLLEAKLPNPFWMKGQVGGYYRLLGGAIKGRCDFKFELGNLCEFASVNAQPSSAVEGLTVISDITPEDGRIGVDVFNAPQVVFNYQINKPFAISDGVDNPVTYKIILDHFKIIANGKEVDGSFEWNKEGDVLVFNPHDILPGRTKINLEAQVHFEELIGTIWQPVKSGKTNITEIKTASFETGSAPDYIPENNVAFSYPINQMMNFYKNEHSTGYIQLLKGQEYLFQQDSKYQQYVRFSTSAGEPPLYMNFKYSPGEKRITCGIPSGLRNNTLYMLEIVNIPAGSSVHIDHNIYDVTTYEENEAGDIARTEKKAEGELTIQGEKVIYQSVFRTSLYNTFSDKIKNLQVSKGYTYPVAQGVYEVGTNINGSEPFDDIEINGTASVAPLVEFRADEKCVWLKEHAYPIIYADYPINGNIFIKWRNTGDLGIVPLKAISFKYSGAPVTSLIPENIKAGISTLSNFSARIKYKLNILSVSDWQDIVTGAFRAPVYTERIARILENPCPSVLFNTSYPVKAIYRLPGTNEVKNEYAISIDVL